MARAVKKLHDLNVQMANPRKGHQKASSEQHKRDENKFQHKPFIVVTGLRWRKHSTLTACETFPGRRLPRGLRPAESRVNPSSSPRRGHSA